MQTNEHATSPNFILRFALELAAWIAAGYWAWGRFDSPLKYGLAIGLPVFLAAIWGIFAVPEDLSRSGNASVPVPGWLRLVIEFVVFGFGAYALYESVGWIAGLVMVFLVIVHYVLATDRIRWLLSQ